MSDTLTISYREPAQGRHRARYQRDIDLAIARYREFHAFNPSRSTCCVRVRWNGHLYIVSAGYHDPNTGEYVPVAVAFATTDEELANG